MKYKNHYEYLNHNLPELFKKLDIPYPQGLITAHGDKCYQYKNQWENANIHFYHGTALYLLARVRPYSQEVRDTPKGWKDPAQWVIDNYQKFKQHLQPTE